MHRMRLAKLNSEMLFLQANFTNTRVTVKQNGYTTIVRTWMNSRAEQRYSELKQEYQNEMKGDKDAVPR